MKYRRLTTQELKPLAEDFAIFLASNSIDKKEWDEMKATNPKKAEEVLDIFSDMVLEKALRSGKYLERISETEIHCYYFQPNQAHMISLRNTVGASKSFIHHSLSAYKTDELEMMQGIKRFTKSREDEMFEIMQTGANLSDGSLYQKLLLFL